MFSRLFYPGQDGNNVGPYVERQGSMAIDYIDPDPKEV